MDKVLVHKGFTTLNVPAFGFVVVVVFGTLLGGLRNYLFSHTTNCVDVKLGAKLFHHLVTLPLAWFESRQVGQSVARVRELDTMPIFLTDGSDTIVNASSKQRDTDVLRFAGDITNERLLFSQSGNDLVIDLSGTTDSVRVQNWYTDAASQVEEIHTQDTVIYASDIDVLVSAMASFSVSSGTDDFTDARILPYGQAFEILVEGNHKVAA